MRIPIDAYALGGLTKHKPLGPYAAAQAIYGMPEKMFFS